MAGAFGAQTATNKHREGQTMPRERQASLPTSSVNIMKTEYMNRDARRTAHCRIESNSNSNASGPGFRCSP